MPAEQTADSLTGRVVGGRYRLIRQIGKGGMGVVYEAEHVGLDRRVAVKFLLERFTDDAEVIERFHREARTASRIGHDHIIDVIDVSSGGEERPYLVMELLEGQDLAAVLAADGPLPAARAVRVIRQVLRGLAAAHAKGIVHRDMKPENVFLIDGDGERDVVKIMDFGISKVIAATDSKVRLTATGAVIGTPIYMAPEQALAQAELDERVDLYAVGGMLFELLAGRPPFIGKSYLGLVTQHLNTPPPSLAGLRPDLPPALVAAVHRALEKDPAHRFQTAAEFAAALPAEDQLDAVTPLGATQVAPATDVRGRNVASPAATGGAATTAPGKRRSARWVIGGALLVAVAMIVVAAAARERGPTARAASPAPSPAHPETAPPPTTTATTGKLDVRSLPAGATVYLDGVAKGATPILIAGVAAGDHALRLEKDGRQTIAMSVRVRGEGVAVVAEELPAIEAIAPSAPAGPSKRGPRKPRPSSSPSSPSSSTTTASTPEPEPAKPQPAKPEPEAGSPATPEPSSPGRPGQKRNPYE